MKENFNYDENMDDDNITITPIYDETSDGTELFDDSNILSDSSDNDSEIEIIAENMDFMRFCRFPPTESGLIKRRRGPHIWQNIRESGGHCAGFWLC